MTATDSTAEPVTVEVPNHESKETEGLLIGTTTTGPSPVEKIVETTHSVTTEDVSAATNEPSLIEESQVPEESEEEAKDDTEEQQVGPEQRIPADIATQRRMEQEKEIETASKEVIEPIKMLKKGATAVVGGTMVGVGLVMIPLPTPMGCVVASSGMAILGSEFEGAKEMNDRMIEKSKDYLEKGREKAIRKIESMNPNDELSDDDSVVSDEESSPSWLKYMNEAERKRQRKLLKQKYRDENKSSSELLRESLSKRTGSFLSRNVLPALNRTKDWGKGEDATVAESEEGTPETTEQGKEVGFSSTFTTSETFQKGKEKMSASFQRGKEQIRVSLNSESLQRGREQMRASFNYTSASFSSMMKRMSPQSGDEKTMNFDEEVSFDENNQVEAPAFQDDAAAPATATATISAAEPGTASVVGI